MGKGTKSSYSYSPFTSILFRMPQIVIVAGFGILIWMLLDRRLLPIYLVVCCVFLIAAVTAFIAIKPLLKLLPTTINVEGDLVSVKNIYGCSSFEAGDIISISSSSFAVEGSYLESRFQWLDGWMCIRYRQGKDICPCYVSSGMRGFIPLLRDLLDIAPSSYKCEQSQFSMPSDISPFIMVLMVGVVLNIWGCIILSSTGVQSMALYIAVIVAGFFCAVWCVLSLTSSVKLEDNAISIRYVGHDWIKIPWSDVKSIKPKHIFFINLGGFTITTTAGTTYWITPYIKDYFDLVACTIQTTKGLPIDVQ